MRSVALVNRSTHLDADDLVPCAAALQTQVSRDFAPLWGIDARVYVAAAPDDGDEVIWLTDDARGAAALLPDLPPPAAVSGPAPRRKEARGAGPRGPVGLRPLGLVVLDACRAAGEPWQAAASHELLELLGDPLLHLAAEAVHDGEPAWFALEVCDPVAGDGYEIDNVPVANFVLPTWFLPGPLPDATLVDFLGRLADPLTLTPAGCAAFATAPGRWQTWCAKRCPPQRRRPPAFSRPARRSWG